MRVVISISNLSPDEGGGFTFEQQILRALLQELDSWPHDWLFIGFGKEPPLALPASPRCSYLDLQREPKERIRGKAEELSKRGRKLLGDPRIGSPLTAAQQAVAERLKERDVQLAWSLVPGGAVPGVPLLTTVWDLQHRLQPIFPEVSANGQWERREALHANTLPQAAGVVVGTNRGRDEVANFYRVPRENIHVVPLPTPRLPDIPESQDEEILRHHAITRGYLYYPAQFWPHKNHVNLLLALRELHDRNRGVHLVLSGSDKGNQPHVAAEARRLGLEHAVHFLGYVPESHMPSLYRGAAALCFPSFFGPDNLPPLEAMSLRCPVLAADVPGAAEQLGDAALRFAPTDPASIASCITHLLADPGLADTLRERGTRRAESWSPRDYVRTICDILTRMESIRRCWPR